MFPSFLSIPLGVIILLGGGYWSDVAAQTVTQPLVGTWSLVSVEQGESAQSLTRVQNPIGLLIQDAGGNVIETVTTMGRSIARTPEEQVAQYTGYSAFWGAFTADSNRSMVTYQIKGDVDPGRMSQQVVRSYERKGDDLTLTEPSSPGRPMRRVVWRRNEELEGLPPYQEAVIGFWRWENAGMVSLSGQMVQPTTPRDASVIVYTPTGHMAVIYLPPPGRKKFAGSTPTAEEARAAMQGLVTYFGVYMVQPKSASVTHYQLAIPNPAQTGSALQRNFEIKGSELSLFFPPTALNGQQVRNTIHLQRLSGLAQMWPDFRRTK
jgi:hypothetical protein